MSRTKDRFHNDCSQPSLVCVQLVPWRKQCASRKDLVNLGLKLNTNILRGEEGAAAPALCPTVLPACETGRSHDRHTSDVFLVVARRATPKQTEDSDAEFKGGKTT